MARLSLLAVAIATIFTCAIASETSEKAKLAVIKQECIEAANAIRKINDATPQSKVQLAAMANDFIVSINYAIYSINNAIPHALSDPAYKLVAWSPQIMGSAVTTIQNAISDTPDQLKEILATTLEKLRDAVIKFDTEYKEGSYFVENQIKRKHDIFLFAIYHLKFQAQLFDKTNKELEAETAKSVTKFVQEVNAIKKSDQTTDDELRHALQHLTVITSKIVYKLENWVEINQKSVDSIKIVEEISGFFSKLYDREKRAANETYKTETLKAKLISVYESIAKPLAKLAEIQYPDNTGGTEYIRSALFDNLAFGLAYSENLRAVLAQA